MLSSRNVRLSDHFAKLSDPRRRKVVYPLVNIVTIAICAVICGADDFVAIAAFGRKKKAWLSQFLDLSAGIPSHDRFNAIFGALKPAEFAACLTSWIAALQEAFPGQVVAIDGKTLRRSFDAASGKAALHLVSAWATANRVSLGQVAVDAKSNEITAIPKLLKMLELSGCLVTVDAIACQTEIARQIVDAGADYVLAVKQNQKKLYNDVSWFFLVNIEDDFAGVRVRRHATTDKGHGREEMREYYVCAVPRDFAARRRWPGLAALGCVVSRVERDGKSTCQRRYYILSKKLAAKEFAAAVRGHWGIENQLHWQLDVTFGEDQSRLRRGHADENFSSLRRTALTLLKNNQSLACGVKNKRLAAGWDDDYLLEVLLGK
jgi:predicted transposase YbfD/YdcC